jgi:DNA-binding response OmpR family regulator
VSMSALGAAIGAGAVAAQPRLLLIDDRPEELAELTRLLREDFALSWATDGHTGWQRAVAQRPDLILLDMQMPGADGLAVCRLLKSDPGTRDIPVIYVSSRGGSAAERLEGLRAGAVDFVAKPFDALELRERVRIHLPRPAVRPSPAAADEAAQRHTDDTVFDAACELIRRHLEELPGHAEIARRVGTSEKRLAALFRARLGLTLSAHISAERTAAGRRLLETTSLSVQTIAQQVGYRSACNFSTAFRERYGVTPLALRRDAGA